MSSPQTISTPVRRFISILVMLLLLAVFLSLYFFKYVPEQKSDYNRRAFMELKSVTDGDRDIFDTYLTILQSDSPGAYRKTSHNTPAHKGEIVFDAGDLSMDYQVDMDTLLKKSDGFSTTNINDVKIEGNDYKLFLYPFSFHDQRTLMAGLISLSHYTSRYESVPIELITVPLISQFFIKSDK